MAEGARLESVYTARYPGFESLSLRHFPAVHLSNVTSALSMRLGPILLPSPQSVFPGAKTSLPRTADSPSTAGLPGYASPRVWLLGLLLLAFVAAGMWHFWSAGGDDLASSYVGCKLFVTGQAGGHLYAYDNETFSKIEDPVWTSIARSGGDRSYLHPYVQTPLWAIVLQPLCRNTQFLTFSRVFLLAILLAFAGTVWLIARYWTPSLLTPSAFVLILVALWFSQPFQYAMFLMQTHALFLFLTVASLILAERRRPVVAGLLLACAAAVKITPAVLLIYWLLTRRWKAAASTVGWSAVLLAVTFIAAGPHLMASYFADLHRISRVLLVSMNNQSFAAWWMGRFYPPDEIYDITTYPLPAAVRWISTALLIGGTAIGGLLDRRRTDHAAESAAAYRAPLGAMVALICGTLFAPIAWTHYSVVLLAPLMVLVEECRSRRISRAATPRPAVLALAGLVLVATALNFQPFATDVIQLDVHRFSVLRGQFFAALLCLAGLACAAVLRRSRAGATWDGLRSDSVKLPWLHS